MLFPLQFVVCNVINIKPTVISDIVYVGSIHPDHAPLSKRFMRAGKHVLCEKPATMNSKQLREVLDVARENNVFFMEVHSSVPLSLHSDGDQKSQSV